MAKRMMRCSKCHRTMRGSTAYDGACKCGGLIEPADTFHYRPSNGTEGCDFMERFCMKCKKDMDECEIIFQSEVFNADEPEYPVEWVADDAVGRGARCTAFEVRDG